MTKDPNNVYYADPTEIEYIVEPKREVKMDNPVVNEMKSKEIKETAKKLPLYLEALIVAMNGLYAIEESNRTDIAALTIEEVKKIILK
tara:strand:+ start:968 stop:1231 length:264 start_codon:yes stop_codon:yes gene_type:complete